MAFAGWQTYDVGFTPGSGAMREDLNDEIINVAPTETPFLTRFGREPVKSTTHEWLEDTDAAAADNAQTEGATFTYTKSTGPERLSNWTQIIWKTIQVTGTAQAVTIAGMRDLYAYELARRLREVANDAEYALVNGTGNSGASGTARRLKGVLAFITSNESTAGSARDITPALIDAAMQDIWTSGASPDTWELYCGGFQKRQISGWSTNTTRNLQASEHRLIDRVDVYDGSLGIIVIVLSRYMPTDEVVMLDTAHWKLAFLRAFKHRRIADTADAVNGVVLGELTLVSYAEELNAYIQDLNTS